MTATAERNETVSAVDQDWGWEFGCEGLMTLDDACEMLSVSRNTLDRLCTEKFLRKGKSPRHDPKNKATRVYICRRSVREYMRSMEV